MPPGVRVIKSSASSRESSSKPRPRSFYECRYEAAARIYTGNKASMVRQNNEEIAKYVDSVYPVPPSFVCPVGLKTCDLKIDVGKLNEEDLGKRYWLVRKLFSYFSGTDLFKRCGNKPSSGHAHIKSTPVSRACMLLIRHCLKRALLALFYRIMHC